MSMSKKGKRVFEADKKMELRLRLAMKRVGEQARGSTQAIEAHLPARELLDRLITRVEQL